MLTIFISHAQEDEKVLLELLDWLKPMQEKYCLRIRYNRKMPKTHLAFPWNWLLFWYSPLKWDKPYHQMVPKEVAEAHIYLYLITHKWMITSWIEPVQIAPAIDRYSQLGDRCVRLYPIAVSPSQWKKFSRLSGFSTLGPGGKNLVEVTPKEDAYFQIVEQLEPVVRELRDNWIEETRRQGLPVDDFYQPDNFKIEKDVALRPLPDWVGWLLIVLLMFSVARWYESCRTRTRMIPLREKATPEVEYRRENPLSPPNETPPFPK
jgi:hypothetical protein